DGIQDGIIDCLASHHLPQNWDNKTCEFEYAEMGMIGLETVYAVINNLFPDISADRITDLLGNNARKIFSLTQPVIKENEVADFTLFTKEGEFIYDANTIKSKSKNSPFINKQLKGKVIGIINKDRVYLND
ncbi:MAG TPA: dihydroorotase, partial [Segetibacter sp.]